MDDVLLAFFPGHFMFGRKYDQSSEASLVSPQFRVTSQACVRFYYNRRGDTRDNMVVRTWEYSPSGIAVSDTAYLLGIGIYPDQWKLGYFDLSAGTYHLEFTCTELLKTAIDDISVVPGLCSQSGRPYYLHPEIILIYSKPKWIPSNISASTVHVYRKDLHLYSNDPSINNTLNQLVR